jgi:multidrug efflux pump subunit AcrA (membrane-fusion protein)
VTVVVAIHPSDSTRLQAEGRLGVGYRVQVRITTSANPNALVVPRSALVRGPAGGWRIHVVRGGLARVQVVQVGLMNDERAEATSGLREGDLVILVPESDLADGVRVRPLPSPPLSPEETVTQPAGAPDHR